MVTIIDAYKSFPRHAQGKSQFLLNGKNNINDNGLNPGIF